MEKLKNKEVIIMDMYQKRKLRAEKKKEDNQKSLPSTSINWLITIYLTPSEFPLFTRLFAN